jgi:predicted ATPase
MKRVLITGMSGTGKSTLMGEFAALGYKTVDTDLDGWCTPADDRESSDGAADR